MKKTSSSRSTSLVDSKPKSATMVRNRTGMSLSELCNAGRYREAREVAEGADSGDPEVRLALGRIALYGIDLERAKDLFTPLVFGAEAVAGEARVYLAHAYYLSGESAEAKALLGDAPDSFGKLLLKGIMEPRPKYALRIFEKCAAYQVRPGMEARLHNQLAQTYRRLDDLDSAVNEYRRALDLYEQDQSDQRPVIFNNLARVYLERGETEQAHACIDQAIEFFQDDLPHLGKALDEKSRIFTAEGNGKAARVKSEQAISVLKQADRKEWLIESMLTYAQALRVDHDDREFAVLREAEDLCRYLQRHDLLIDVLVRRLRLSEEITNRSERDLLKTAAAGNVSYRAVAAKLRTTHWSLLRLAKKHGI